MLRKLGEMDKSKEEKNDISGNKTKEVQIDDNVDFVETENDELDDDVDETDNIDRPRTYLERYKKIAPSLKMVIMYDDINHNKLTKIMR